MQHILLLVDAENGFNFLSRLGMLWTVWDNAALSLCGLHSIATITRFDWCAGIRGRRH